MKYLLNLLFLSFILLNGTACTLAKNDFSKINKTSQAKLKPSDYSKSCQFLFNKQKKPLTDTNIWDCFRDTLPTNYSQLIDRLLLHKPALTKKNLGAALNSVTHTKETTGNSDLVKKLLDAGASTSYITMNNILTQRADVCDSVTLIIKNNLRLYKDARPEYLQMLTQINRGYASCSESIRLLISYNPKLLDIQNSYSLTPRMTPLHQYLVGVDHPKWDVNIAKLLMTKKNVKLKDSKGYTPLHYIQLYITDNEKLHNTLIQAVEKLSNMVVDRVALKKDVERIVLKDNPVCQNIIDNKSLNKRKVLDCFLNTYLETPYLVDRLLEHKPAVSKEMLSILAAQLTHDSYNVIHTKSIEKLIKAGASTENMVVPAVLYGNDFSCNTLILVLKNNSHLYNDERFLNAAPKTQRGAESKRNIDLQALSAVGLERGICPEAIQFLANNHPHLRDVQGKYGSTALHIYLGDTHWSGWDLKTLKVLISKNNINLQDKLGNTPLHYLNSGAASHIIREHEIRIIKTMMEHGADVTIKNKKGKSPQDMFEDKNPKLKTLFNERK